MYVGEALFCRGHLSAYLDQERNALRDAVNKHVDLSDPDVDAGTLCKEIVAEVRIAPLRLHFDQVQKHIVPARVTIYDFGREIEIDGVRATRVYPFEGEQGLFQARPGIWTSVVPYGIISHSSVTIGVEGRNDRDMLKRELDQQEKLLQDYVGWICADIQAHNDTVAPRVAQFITARRNLYSLCGSARERHLGGCDAPK